MRLIWYNRDEFSDQDLRQAKALSKKLMNSQDKATSFEIDFSFWDSSKKPLGSIYASCQICNGPIIRHSTGNYHLHPNLDHQASPVGKG
jgi:hypothetical protein